MSFLNDLKRIPLVKDMPLEIKVVKEKMWLAIEKDHRRFYPHYTAASQTGPYMAHIEGDRHGYSRSLLKGSQDFSKRLATDADDAQCLILYLSPQQPAIVFDTSSVAIVAQALLVRHSSCVATLVVHEPPCFDVLPQEFRVQRLGVIQHIYDTYRAHGPIAAMEAFIAGLSEGQDGPMMRRCMDPAWGDEVRANSLFWFEFELRQYPGSVVDLDAIVKEKEKYVPVAGTDSGDGPGVAPIATIARAVEKDVIRLPGRHVGYMTEPGKWADAFVKALASRTKALRTET